MSGIQQFLLGVVGGPTSAAVEYLVIAGGGGGGGWVGGGGGAGGAPDAEDEDFEFMLRVMKMIQSEQDLRAQTRVLEQLRRSTGSLPTSPDQR